MVVESWMHSPAGSGPLYSGLPCVSLTRSTQLRKPSRARDDAALFLRRFDRSCSECCPENPRCIQAAFHAAACTCAGAHDVSAVCVDSFVLRAWYLRSPS